MKYVHAPNGIFQQIVLPGQIVEFSQSVKTTVKRLTSDQKTEFGVSILKMVSPPAYNLNTENRQEVDPLLIDGVWTQQWSVTSVVPTDTDELANFITGYKQKMKDDLASIRFDKETTGITVNGMVVATDRSSQAMLTGSYTTVQINPETIIDWKGVNGWVQLNKADIEALSQAVSNHVQSCFTNEKNISAQIDASTTVEELESIDINVEWPVDPDSVVPAPSGAPE